MQKEKQPYEFKRKYAQIRAEEFRTECDRRGLNCHVSVGGLDSIVLYLFLHEICDIDAPGVSASYLEDKSIQKVHKALGIINVPPLKRDDGTYRLEFNTNEMYQIDFENCTFTYGRYSIAYTYNWKTDVASSSTCNYNFETEHSSDGCDVSVIDTMKDVRQDLAMELYYCGLLLEDLLAEMK